MVVTFQSEPATLDNIALLRPQVDDLIVVDNGSSKQAVVMLREASVVWNLTLVENQSNLGIAAALNLGVVVALSHHHSWVIVFDQDSTVTPGFVEAMALGYRHHPLRDSVGIFCPHYVDRLSGAVVETTAVLADGSPIVAMTSGSLMPTWVFKRCGWFLEELFVDQVDVEYCFRLRSAGYLIARSPEARLLHSAGCPRLHRAWGLGSFRATHHSALRRYYMTRNRLWITRKYWRMHLGWCLPILRSILTDTVKLALVEDSKTAKLRSTFAGALDAIRGRLGEKLAS